MIYTTNGFLLRTLCPMLAGVFVIFTLLLDMFYDFLVEDFRAHHWQQVYVLLKISGSRVTAENPITVKSCDKYVYSSFVSKEVDGEVERQIDFCSASKTLNFI